MVETAVEGVAQGRAGVDAGGAAAEILVGQAFLAADEGVDVGAVVQQRTAGDEFVAADDGALRGDLAENVIEVFTAQGRDVQRRIAQGDHVGVEAAAPLDFG